MAGALQPRHVQLGQNRVREVLLDAGKRPKGGDEYPQTQLRLLVRQPLVQRSARRSTPRLGKSQAPAETLVGPDFGPLSVSSAPCSGRATAEVDPGPCDRLPEQAARRDELIPGTCGLSGGCHASRIRVQVARSPDPCAPRKNRQHAIWRWRRNLDWFVTSRPW